MSTEANKAIVRRYFAEFWNASQLDVVDELVHPDAVDTDGALGAEPYKTGNRAWHEILPDIHFTLDELVAEGDTVVARWTARGTHRGDWETPIGTAVAQGKVTVTSGTSTFHFRNGRIIADFNHIDFLPTLAQMGASLRPPQ
jgi:predicted ester cyclase